MTAQETSQETSERDSRVRNVAVIGSPSTNTELTIDLLEEASGERLVGALTAFEAVQDRNSITSVGQIVGIELRNRWHEDSVFRNLIKRTGEIPPITNRQDTRTANLAVGATFRRAAKGYEPEVLGMVPPTGTRVYRVDQALLDSLLEVYRSEVFYLGKAYCSDVMYPTWLKHFASGPGGADEAYHLGVFGKTGSGKSGLAKMMLCAYSRHPQMGILIIDPQGEFSLELGGVRVGQQGLQLDKVVASHGREIHIYRIGDLQLDDWTTFEEMLISLRFFEQLSIPASSTDNARRAAEVISKYLREKHSLDGLASLEALRDALTAISEHRNAEYVYATKSRAQQLRERAQYFLDSPEAFTQLLEESWKPICNLFAPGESRRRLFTPVGDEQPGIINMLLESAENGRSRPAVVIDISRQGNQEFWSEELQRRILGKLLNILISQASSVLAHRRSANVLVLLDEAHRHAPNERLDEGSEAEVLRSLLRRAVRETRKYGIGWFFISQTVGGLDSEILKQLRILAFGFGLGMGTELDRLREFVAGDQRSLELYQSFRDPQSFPRRDLQEFPFMAVGPISPLAFSGKPVFFTAFTNPEEFLRANALEIR